MLGVPQYSNFVTGKLAFRSSSDVGIWNYMWKIPQVVFTVLHTKWKLIFFWWDECRCRSGNGEYHLGWRFFQVLASCCQSKLFYLLLHCHIYCMQKKFKRAVFIVFVANFALLELSVLMFLHMYFLCMLKYTLSALSHQEMFLCLCKPGNEPDSDLYVGIHVAACWGACDWQALGWLEWAVFACSVFLPLLARCQWCEAAESISLQEKHRQVEQRDAARVTVLILVSVGTAWQKK